MQTEKHVFDDLTRVAGGALNALTGLKAEIESLVTQKIEHLLGPLNLVSREEFEAVRVMAVNAREEQEKMTERLAVLEAELAVMHKNEPAGKS